MSHHVCMVSTGTGRSLKQTLMYGAWQKYRKTCNRAPGGSIFPTQKRGLYYRGGSITGGFIFQPTQGTNPTYPKEGEKCKFSLETTKILKIFACGAVLCMFICIYVCIYDVCMYICMYIYVIYRVSQLRGRIWNVYNFVNFRASGLKLSIPRDNFKAFYNIPEPALEMLE
jgi:hypothetical protein